MCSSGWSWCLVLLGWHHQTGLGRLYVPECFFPAVFLLLRKTRQTTWASFRVCDLGCFSPSLSQTKLANGTSSMIVPKQRKLSASYEKEKELCIKYFEQWSESDQVEFVEHLISQMCHYQHGHINSYLKPMLQRDFITALPGNSADRGNLVLRLVFQKTISGSVCKINDSFWIESSILIWNVAILYFVLLISLKAWSNATMVWLGVNDSLYTRC